MPCEQFTPIGGQGYGFCQAHERHVSMPAFDPKLKCLCDHCSIGADGTRHLSQDVYFYKHDFVGLKSEEKVASDKRATEGAAMQCAVPGPKPEPNAAPKPPKARKPQKPQPRLF